MSNTETESEYVRGSECARIVIKTGQCINNMRDEIISEKKKSNALDLLAKEFSDKYKSEHKKNLLLQQEMEQCSKAQNKESLIIQKEIEQRHTKQNNEITLLQQELEYYKSKQNKKLILHYQNNH
jgi:hypothetical protein